MRMNVVNIQMKTNKEILDRLIDAEKISKKEYQEYLDLVMEKYEREMSEIEALKDIISKNE